MDASFDDLARGLGAGSLPRRQVLKLMAVTALGAAIGLRPQPARAGHCATERVCKKVDGKMTCLRPFGGDNNPSGDCKCPPGAKEGDGCVDARPHCGSSDKPC